MTTPSPFRFSLVLLTFAAFTAPALADSQARIVRLSDVQGSVELDKNTGSGFEKAFVNLPITQGTELRTGKSGRAEVEFEDGSSMRLTPNTTLQFSKLSLSDSGQRVSELNMVEGMAYVNWLGKDDLALNFSREKISLDRAAHFRINASPDVASLAVFKGDLNVAGPGGELSVDKKNTATFDVADNDKSSVEHKVAEDPLDSWDKEAVSYHDEYAKNNNNSPYGYGASDMSYYGAYSNVPGYGMMWQPYFSGVGWDPFMNGVWGFYPGYGYMFASAYPWGWLPYRYGTWAFAPGFGWGWQPGGWGTYLGAPIYRPTTLVRVNPLVAPTAGTKTVMVGHAGNGSAFMPPRMTVNAGTAGMGIPRGSLNNMNQLNQQVSKNGFAQVHSAPAFAATPVGRSSAPFGGNSSSAGYTAPRSSTMGSSMGHSAPAGHASSGGASHH
jgi:hypothetical protein